MSGDDLARGYEIEALIPDWQQHVARMAAASERVRKALGGRLDVAFGPDPLQRLDLFMPPAKGAPVQVYIHGGAWRGSDKAGRAYPAELFVSAGVIWAPINYRLAPAASLDQIVDDVRLAVSWVYKNADGIGADRDRIYVSGNSAGGHLAGMLLAEGWEEAFAIPAGVVKGACAVSGVFDMRPIMRTSLNEALGLDERTADRNSPIRHLPAIPRPLIVAWGERETAAFKQQSRDYAAAWRAKGFPVREIEVADHHHFSILAELADRDSPLARAMLDQMAVRA
jgi:arylformamidase